MAHRDIIVVGGSAGSIEPMGEILSAVPRDLPAAWFFVLHVPSESVSHLPEILSRSGYPARHAVDGEKVEPGRVYVAPTDRHLMLENGNVRVVLGPRHNRHRPSIDPLFRSAAKWYGTRVIGVILSGSLDDGSAGLHAIKSHGGIAYVQDPETALVPSMPLNAMAQVVVDGWGTPSELASLIARRVCETIPAEEPKPDAQLDEEIAGHLGMHTDMDTFGKPSVFTCPECHGTLWVSDRSGLPQFQCRVGHSYTMKSLLADHEATLESILWSATRALEENISLRRHIAHRMRATNQANAADAIEKTAIEAEAHAEKLRALLVSRAPRKDLDPEAS